MVEHAHPIVHVDANQIDERHHCAQNVVEIVGNAASQRAQRLELLRLPQLTFELGFGAFGSQRFRHVADRSD